MPFYRVSNFYVFQTSSGGVGVDRWIRDIERERGCVEEAGSVPSTTVVAKNTWPEIGFGNSFDCPIDLDYAISRGRL